jgi:hypothetical protein
VYPVSGRITYSSVHYTFTDASGRTYTATDRVLPSWKTPQYGQIEVEYLLGNPRVSRISGNWHILSWVLVILGICAIAGAYAPAFVPWWTSAWRVRRGDSSLDVKRDFDAIQDAWKQELPKLPNSQEVYWTAPDPVVLVDEGLALMFKEGRISFKAESVAVEGRSRDLRVESTGYAVAKRDTAGRWIPTALFFMDKHSPEEALAEMHRIRDKIAARG